MFCRTLMLKKSETMLRVPVRFDESANADEFNRRMAEVIKAERHMKKVQTAESEDAYGNALERLYNLIFGVEQTGTIESFFMPDMFKMMNEVNPFIVQKIVPAVRRASARNRENAKRKFLKEQRRRLKK